MKTLKLLGIIILSIFIVIQVAKFMFRTPVFTGQVLDVTTGQPIENAIVTAVWWKSKIEGSGPCNSVTVITGKDGKYEIPRYTRIHLSGLYIFDPLFCMTLGAEHPLYEGVQSMTNPVWREQGGQSKKIEFKGEKQADRAIKYDMRLMGLEEAIKQGAEEYKNTGKGGFNLGSFFGNVYSATFLTEHWDSEFVKDILKKWEEIMNIYCPDNKYVEDEFNKIKKGIEEVYTVGK